MSRCDALIVGGGPAGLAAAIALRQKGLDVLVAEALRPPIDKACGEGLMPDAQVDLAALGIQLTAQQGAAFEGISFLSRNHQATALFGSGRGIGIRRLQLHNLLVERCEQLGVRLAWGSRVSITSRRSMLGSMLRPMLPSMLLDGEPCTYRYAIAADGQSSRVRQAIGLDRGCVLSRRFGARSHFQLKPWSCMAEVHWGDLGQAYITPVGPDEICVATVSRDPAHRMEAVLADMPELRLRLEGARQLGGVRGALTTTRKLRRVTTANVALTGDASGSADAITGEGIALSFRQALLLAEAIDQDNLAIYEAGHPAILRMPHLMSMAMLRLDAWPWLREWAIGLFAAQPQLFTQLLSLHLGERSLGNFLIRDAPALGLRLLTQGQGN